MVHSLKVQSVMGGRRGGMGKGTVSRLTPQLGLVLGKILLRSNIYQL